METEVLTVHLRKIFPEARIKTRYIDRIAYASDAGFYHLLPKAIVHPASVHEIQQLLQLANEMYIPIVFRGGGTSLSGQSITDGILADLSKHWRKAIPENSGIQIRTEPGITGAMVNHILKKYKRKIGPDPSSISAAMMGGILANNASGMCCGVAVNSYHTLQSIKFVLPDGKIFDTGRKEDYARFEQECTLLASRLSAIRSEIGNNKILYKKIRDKYLIKNTVGYGLNSFVDFQHPLDIFAHLLIGSEGTLGFIAEAVLNTVPDLPFKSTALLYFPDIHSACSAIIPLKASGAEALELMDRAALRSVENTKGAPPEFVNLPYNAAALLCEYQADTLDSLHALVEKSMEVCMKLQLLQPPDFTMDPYRQDLLWKLRKGMFPSVGAVRAQGTTVILEDVAFPLLVLADAVTDIQQLFRTHGYENGIIFGHAKDGNIHFVVSQSFNTPDETSRYERFIGDVVSLVVHKYNGSLKAEHGTGRNMAPFVVTEWGAEAYAIMQEIKQMADPNNILNPGVIINNDARAHLKNLKELPVVDAEVDKCMECGFCEHRCPSRDITITPRQRIVVRREMKRLERRGQNATLTELVADYQYDGMDTCAVDGQCATVCPVDINTGDLIKKLRRENHSAAENRVATSVAKYFFGVELFTKFLLHAGKFINEIFGSKTVYNITAKIKSVIAAAPLWPSSLKGPATYVPQSFTGAEVVYLPTCISRMMGCATAGKPDIINTFISVAKKAKIKVNIPDATGFCCGQAFSSKGFSQAASVAMNKTIEALWDWSNHGTLAIVTDLSSCTHTLQTCSPYLTSENSERWKKLKILDTVDFACDVLVQRLSIERRKEKIVLHPVCSLTKMNLMDKLKSVAAVCAETVDIPYQASCCGMAGDRGFFFPELTTAAIRPEATEVNAKFYDGYYSTAKSCEIALSEVTHQNYESIMYLLDEVSV